MEVVVLVPNSPYGLCGRKASLNRNSEVSSCVKVEVAALGSLSLIVHRTVSVDVKLRLRLCRWRFAAEVKAKVKNNFSVRTS